MEDSPPQIADDPRVRSERWHMPGIQALNRIWVTPESPVRGWVIFLPGLGDYVSRYLDWFILMADRGWGVLAPDWPGHGDSLGRRGDIASLEQCDDIVDACLDALEARHGGGRRAIFGHSMGALIAVRELARAPMEWRWAWLSSPLLKPSLHNRGLRRRLAPFIARLTPQAPFDTGVRPSDCQLDSSALAGDEKWHHQVSARFGMALIDEEDRLELQSRRLRRQLPLLVTQGSQDPVCPPQTTREWVEAFRERGVDVTYAEIEGGLHEPLLDPAFRDLVRDQVNHWLQEAVPRDRGSSEITRLALQSEQDAQAEPDEPESIEIGRSDRLS